MEEAIENGQEIWLIFQDMAKAFDSVGLTPLKKSLERIKMPDNINRFIIDLFNDRQMRIITSYGFSDTCTGEDGIDQGETISPLLWRIFYDPLLCRIQEDKTLGVTTQIKWPSKNVNKPTYTITHRTAASAFVDDTVWITKNKTQAQTVINISNEFFALNDIKINGAKSELMVINSTLSREEQ